MIIFKCKMCGGDLEIDEQMAVGTCQHCGSTMTLPKASEEKVTSLFNRANHYRRNSEFGKAIKVYENILNEDNLNAEAYWGLVLCKFGIEYVEDPATGQRIPTCHRAQKTPIFLDVDYQQAIECADETARALYKAEAATIDTMQKQILAISEQEEPYDIFFCYKETSETGSRTKDSVLAQDIYHHLNEAGYKVFFSRISLEEKLGTAYEPYIFAALNSAPVMIVVATSTESVNAVWTKNEWSRYLALINKGEKKTLIPVYRDMDPYDLPEEFSHLQALDMSKLGFMQDLVRGVKKILDGHKNRQLLKTNNASMHSETNIETLLVRAQLHLEDGEWHAADILLERVLDVDPKNAKAYIGKLMVELKVKVEERLPEQMSPLEESANYKKALRFAKGDYHETIGVYDIRNRAWIEKEKVRLEDDRKELIYQEALLGADLYENRTQQREKYYRLYAEKFKSISGYKDADSLAAACVKLADNTAQNLEDDYKKRPLLKKILGFRSLTPWKMVMASIFYLFWLVLVAAIVSNVVDKVDDIEIYTNLLFSIVSMLCVVNIAACLSEGRQASRYIIILVIAYLARYTVMFFNAGEPFYIFSFNAYSEFIFDLQSHTVLFLLAYIIITVTDKRSPIEPLKNLKAKYIKKPIWRYIFGYRSLRPWNVTIASFGYLIIIILALYITTYNHFHNALTFGQSVIYFGCLLAFSYCGIGLALAIVERKRPWCFMASLLIAFVAAQMLDLNINISTGIEIEKAPPPELGLMDNVLIYLLLFTAPYFTITGILSSIMNKKYIYVILFLVVGIVSYYFASPYFF